LAIRSFNAIKAESSETATTLTRKLEDQGEQALRGRASAVNRQWTDFEEARFGLAEKLWRVRLFAKAKRSRADCSEALDKEHCGEATARHLVS
jgi:hypothetical protein